MKKIFILTVCAMLVSFFTTGQSLLGTWETQAEIKDNGTPILITVIPFFGNDGTMSLHCEMEMTIDALEQGTPKGDLELGFATDAQGTWVKSDDQLTMTLDCSGLQVYGTKLMMPNLDVESANAIVERIQPVIDAMQGELNNQFTEMVRAFSSTFTIVKLTHEELSIDDGSDDPVVFLKADVGEYDPE